MRCTNDSNEWLPQTVEPGKMIALASYLYHDLFQLSTSVVGSNLLGVWDGEIRDIMALTLMEMAFLTDKDDISRDDTAASYFVMGILSY